MGADTAIYVRVSGASQEDNYSIPTQEAACRAYAAREGLVVSEAHVYREVHTATELHERPELSRLREAMARGEIAALVCYDPDRFSRMQVHTAILQDICERAGVALRFAMFDFEATATGRFMLGARAFAAELELEKIKERTGRGLRAKVASGKLHGRARPPWGYRYDETRTRLLIDEATAPYVRLLFARAAAGETTRALMAWLNDSGIPTAQGGRQWHRVTVTLILRQRAYIGEALAFTTRRTRERGKARRERLGDDEIVALPAGTIPPLVDRATWEAVQRRLERNRAESTRRNREPERFLLRAGFIVCGVCGRGIASGWRTMRGTRYPIYRVEAERHRACSPKPFEYRVHAGPLDAATWEAVLEHLFDPRRLFPDEGGEAPADPAAETLRSVERLIADTDRAIRNVTAAIRAIDDDDARTPLLAELRALAARRKGLIAERDGLVAGRAAREAERERRRALMDLWGSKLAEVEALDYRGRRDLLALLGVRVKLWPHGGWTIVTREAPDGIAHHGAGDAIEENRSRSAFLNRRFIVLAEHVPADRGAAGKRARRTRP